MSGIELNLTPTFQRSLAKLTKQEQNVVNQAVRSFWMNPSLLRLRFHSLNFREPRPPARHRQRFRGLVYDLAGQMAAVSRL